MRLVEVTSGLVVGVVEPPVEGAPLAVGGLGEVGDEHVGVDVRVAGAAGAVPEHRRHESVDGLGLQPAVALPGRGGVRFEVPERGGDGPVVGVANDLRHLGGAEGEQQRDRLRRSPAQVEPAHLAVRERPELLAATGVEAAPHGHQIVGADLAVEAQLDRGGGASPPPGSLADASVVLVDALGDGVEVVALGRVGDGVDAEHRSAPAAGRASGGVRSDRGRAGPCPVGVTDRVRVGRGRSGPGLVGTLVQICGLGHGGT